MKTWKDFKKWFYMRGISQYRALPEDIMKQLRLKCFMINLCILRQTAMRLEFEVLLKVCAESIG